MHDADRACGDNMLRWERNKNSELVTVVRF